MAKKIKIKGGEPRTWSGGSPAPSSAKQIRPRSQADVVDWIKQNPKLTLGNDHPKSRANGAPGGTATLPGRSNSKPV
jgi:hypothetical protein